METVNAEFRAWLNRRDAQRTFLQDSVTELTNEIELIKTAVAARLVGSEVDSLRGLASDALSAAQADMQGQSFQVGPREAASVTLARQASDGTPAGDFVRGLLHKLAPIVRESVQHHVSGEMVRCAQEFEPWLRESDEKRAALFSQLETLKGKLDTLKSDPSLPLVARDAESALVQRSQESGVEVQNVLPTLLPLILEIIREAARRHLMNVMEGVNAEFQEWLHRHDVQRAQLLDTVTDLTKEFEFIKAAVQMNLVSPQVGELAALTSDALASASTDLQPVSLSGAFARSAGAAQDVAMPYGQSGIAPADEFMRGLLEKLKPIVRESVQTNCSAAIEKATQEFEPWLQQSDEKRAALFGKLQTLKGQMETLKAEVSGEPASSSSTALAQQGQTFSVQEVLPMLMPMLLQSVREAARQHTFRQMEGVNAEFQEWLQRRDAQRTYLLGAMTELSRDFEQIKAAVENPKETQQRREPIDLGFSAAARPRDVSPDPLATVFRPMDAQAVDTHAIAVPRSPLETSIVPAITDKEEFMRGLLQKLGVIVRESVAENVNVAMVHAAQEFEPWLQRADEKRDALFGQVATLKDKLQGLKADLPLELGKSVSTMEGSTMLPTDTLHSTMLASATASRLEGDQYALARQDAPGDITILPADQIVPFVAVETILPLLAQIVKGVAVRHVVTVMSGVNAEFKDWLKKRDEQRRDLQFAMIELSNELVAIKAAAAAPKPPQLGRLADAAAAEAQDSSPPFAPGQSQAAPPPIAGGDPPLDDFTRGLLEKLGGIVRESVQEHVTVAMDHANKEFEPWLQQSDQRQAAMLENVESLRRSLTDLDMGQP
jgi:hypothetical protein